MSLANGEKLSEDSGMENQVRASLTSKCVVEDKMSGTRKDSTLGKVRTFLFVCYVPRDTDLE